MPLKCDVELQHPANGITFDNGFVSGFVKFTVDKPTKVSGVIVAVLGKGHCHWTETNGKNRSAVCYSNEEEYLNAIEHLMQPDYGKGQLEIDPGIYNFPFNIHIPHGVPSSFEHMGGYVRYKLQVRFLRPWTNDLRFSRRLTVYSRIDLNLNPVHRIPATAELKKKFYTLVVKNGELDIEVRTVASGFVPGQVIPVHCAFRNDSNVKIKYVKILLCQYVMYISNSGNVYNVSPIPVAKDMVDMESELNQLVFERQITVPPTARTSLLNSKIISVTYKLLVKVKVSGLHASPVVTLPLVIGSTPLHNIPGPSGPMLPGLEDINTTLEYPDAPPSYSQATQVRYESSEDEDSGEKK